MDHNSEGTSEVAVRLRWGSADQLLAAAQKYIASGAGEMSRKEIEAQIAQYERMFGMSSEEFMHRMREGTAPDTFETMDWLILLRHR